MTRQDKKKKRQDDTRQHNTHKTKVSITSRYEDINITQDKTKKTRQDKTKLDKTRHD